MKKILIANRGEIALRILRSCKEMGIKTVAVHSTIDKNLKHVLLADETVCIGPPEISKSYLNIPSIISAAEITGSTAIHPGYGFLAENANFAEQVEKSGFIFIGPKADTIKKMGDKISAINIMKSYKIPCIPGSNKKISINMKKNYKYAEKIGYPIILKSSKGGGGRGIRIVKNKYKLKENINLVKKETNSSFNDKTIFMEKYLHDARHIEIQILADGKGNAVYISNRDCSIQLNNRKILEEAPAIGINKNIIDNISKICINVCIKMKYKGVGTFEFLYKNKKFFFIEMNTRIQVEHTITEMITGIDLIKEQINISFGNILSIKQNQIKTKGHSIECRINAENIKTLLPSTGKIEELHIPSGFGIRWESHIYNGYSITHYYDSMIAKIISLGENRYIAIKKMQNALTEIIISGIETNIKLQKKILNNKKFIKGKINSKFIKDMVKNIIDQNMHF
ncbi:acetyl-CoA carboxylase biotin carboxylase subunit [Buchnera aphidicola (Neophyllaphis podocarpi)]|uniref:acetyl-CoA carboxylase biotin carboxylase subunit n=1 Tax=Buchnera aphidicola TaxID=9 RepID=UPI0031B8AF70